MTDPRVAATIVGIAVVLYTVLRGQNEGDDTASPAPGRRLEKDCEETLRSLGWHILPLPRSRDVGADVYATKNRHTLIVQCKDLKRPVGIRAVQEAYFADNRYKADYICVVATGDFSADAKRHAENAGVELLHIDKLKAFAHRLI